MNTQIPITESRNPLSHHLDIAPFEEFIDILSQCEHEIFINQYGLGIYDQQHINHIDKFRTLLYHYIAQQRYVEIIVMGAGTSGRLCKLFSDYYHSSNINSFITITPILAGGIQSLIKAQVGAEDQREQGYSDNCEAIKKSKSDVIITIGITCGLSSSYIAGGLESCISHGYQSYLIGFNYPEQATMKCKSYHIGKEIIFLGCIIGSEALTGSVRMKGGTATLVLLYILIFGSNENHIGQTTISILQGFEQFHQSMAKEIKTLRPLFESGADYLKHGKSICYKASGWIGYLCLYDQAECYPTFGANSGQIACIVHIDGLGDINTQSDLSDSQSIKFSRNTIVYDNQTIQMPTFQNNFHSIIYYRSLLSWFSTYCFTQYGKVYQNIMIDPKITNKKLLLRGLRILQQALKINYNEAHDLLTRTLQNLGYTGIISFDPNNPTIEQIIQHIATINKLIPITILHHHLPSRSLSQLQQLLNKEQIITKSVIKFLP